MPSYPQKMIPRLRVNIDRFGRVTVFNPMTDNSTEWWDSVLSDPRTRPRKDPDWMDRLDRHRGGEIAVSCHRCGIYKTLLADDLIATYGGACACISAVFSSGLCGKRPNACQVIYATRKIPE